MLKAQLQVAIPAELYKVEPGQIALFISKDGINPRTAVEIVVFLDSLSVQVKGTKLSFITTDDELLIDCVAARNSQEIGLPYKVVVGDLSTLAGFAKCFGVDMDESIDREQPIIVSLDPRDNPEVIKQENSSGPLMQALTARPTTEKQIQDYINKAEYNIEKVLRECALFDIDIDLDKIKNRFAAAMNSTVDYQLSFKVKVDKMNPLRHGFSVFDIYVADGDEYMLNLTAWQKAVYLTFLLYDKGICILDTYGDFREISREIYQKLPFDKNKCDKDDGDMDARLFEGYISTMHTYLTKIRNEVSTKIDNPKTAIEFAIEGYSGKEFSIKRSTPEIRAQIKEWFRL